VLFNTAHLTHTVGASDISRNTDNQQLLVTLKWWQMYQQLPVSIPPKS